MLKPLFSLALCALLGSQACAQNATFTTVTTYPTGSANMPYGVAAGDVNNDGKPDLVTATVGNSIGIFLGNGTGTFQPVSLLTNNGVQPSGIVLADVNGDGKLDLLISNYGSNSVGVNLGNGNGTFQAMTTYSAGAYSHPEDIAVADVNRDGKLDLLTANNGSDTVGVLLGTGTGTFQAVTTYSTGAASSPYDVEVADVNGDGKLDLLTANEQTDTIGVLLANSNGTFQPVVAQSIGDQPFSVAVADVNADGYLDLLAACASDDVVSLRLGNGNGTFQAATTYTTGGGSYPLNLAIADVNGDKRPDLLVASLGFDRIRILLGNGNGTFQAFTSLSPGPGSGPYQVIAADLNGDNRLDIATANYFSSSVGVLLNTTPLATRATLPGASATLAPNPASTATTLTLASLPATVAQVQATLVDATGRTVGQQRLVAAQGTARAEVPTAGLAAGLYVVRLVASDAQGQPLGSLPAQHLSVR